MSAVVSSNHFGRVAVMMGGHSAEREVSLKSGKAVLDALLSKGIDAYAFDPASDALSDLTAQQTDRVFIALHGRGGEDGSMQGALEILGIPYTGSGILGCALAMDKVRTKAVWQARGLPVAASITYTAAEDPADAWQHVTQLLGHKVIVKPANEGSSLGMSVAASEAELTTALKEAFVYDQEVLIERWIDGKEYTVAMLDGEALPSIQLVTTHEFYDFSAKYQANDTQYHCPSDLSADDEYQLGSMAAEAFAALGCQGWGRVDAMRDEQGNWYLLEANAVPGMTEKSLVPMAAKAKGYSFADLVSRILAQTLEL